MIVSSYESLQREFETTLTPTITGKERVHSHHHRMFSSPPAPAANDVFPLLSYSLSLVCLLVIMCHRRKNTTRVTRRKKQSLFPIPFFSVRYMCQLAFFALIASRQHVCQSQNGSRDKTEWGNNRKSKKSSINQLMVGMIKNNVKGEKRRRIQGWSGDVFTCVSASCVSHFVFRRCRTDRMTHCILTGTPDK